MTFKIRKLNPCSTFVYQRALSSNSGKTACINKPKKRQFGERHEQQRGHRNRYQYQQFNRNDHRRRSIQKNKNAPREDNQGNIQSTNKKWLHPFWCPSVSSLNQNRRGSDGGLGSRQHYLPTTEFRDERLPCRMHLDPNNSIGLPTSTWIQLFGALPMTSLEEVLESIETILRDKFTSSDGIIDLDASWNPVKDTSIPLYSLVDASEQLDNDFSRRNKTIITSAAAATKFNNDVYDNEETKIYDTPIEPYRVKSAHVLLSYHGRPTGWNLKLSNASFVNALLIAANDSRIRGTIRIGWKFVQVKEFHPPLSPVIEDPSDSRTTLNVDDTMVRFENCPPGLTQDHLRHILSRYELAMEGETIVKWMGMSNTPYAQPLTYVVRFARADWARAAVREMQAFEQDGKIIKLVQYPKQLVGI